MLDRARRLFSFAFDPLLDFVFPPVCISCNNLLSNGRRKVCEECWQSIQPVTRSHELYRETRGKLKDVGSVSDLVSCYVFEKEGAFQHIAHHLKYQGFESLGLELGRRLGGTIQDWNVKADLIIPIPLHTIKRRERGYNQAELIARGVSQVSGIPVRSDLVHRRRHTQSQTLLSVEQRQKNVEDAFEVKAAALGALRGKTCIVIDDVITSGATITSCARELLNAGVSKVIAASSALAQKDALV